MAIKDKYIDKIVKDYTTSSKSRTYNKFGKGFPNAQTSHDTGNPGSTAKQNCNYMKSTNKPDSSAHSFIDDIEIRLSIPLDEEAWHVRYDVPWDNAHWGTDAITCALGHELCYGGNINFAKAYDMYVWFHVYCAKKFGISLARIEGHYVLDPARRTDPINAFSQNGITWARFMADIQNYYDHWESDGENVGNATVHKVKSGDTLWDIARSYKTTVDAIRKLNPGIDVDLIHPGDVIIVKDGKTATIKPSKPKPSYIGKRVESKVGSLNYYDGPRWDKPYAQLSKGYGFPTIVDRVKVDGAYMYKVKNSKGKVFYVTASDKYVRVVY